MLPTSSEVTDGDDRPCWQRSCSIFRKRCLYFCRHFLRPCFRPVDGRLVNIPCDGRERRRRPLSNHFATHTADHSTISNVTSASRYRPPFNQGALLSNKRCVIEQLLVLFSPTLPRIEYSGWAARNDKNEKCVVWTGYHIVILLWKWDLTVFPTVWIYHPSPFSYKYN